LTFGFKLKTLSPFETSATTAAKTQQHVPKDSNLPKWVTVLYVFCVVGRDISVGIATLYGMDVPGIESWWEARFYTPVQNGPRAHQASCTMGTWYFPGGKTVGTWRWPPTPI
jgi:hypothetical protein